MQRITVNNPQNVIDGTAKKYYFKLRQTGGPKGDKGDKGDTGATGPQGPQGNAATVSVGSTTTLPVGYDATVTNSGSIYNAVLDFGIPQGPQGPQGAKGDKGDTGAQGETGPRGPQGERGTNATVYVGTTTTTNPGTQARVYNSGTDSNAVLNFEIPRGDVGPSVPLVQETGYSTTKAMSQNATTEALNGKQNTLTAGSNIQISGSTISATDTKYSAGNGITLTGTQFSANTSVLATKNDLGSYYTKTQIDSQMAAKQDDLVAGSNIQIAPDGKTISATDTTYTAGTGLTLTDTEFSADTTVLATQTDLTTSLAPKLETEVVSTLPATGAEGKLYLTPKNYTRGTGTGNPITATVEEEAGAIESFKLDGDTFQQSYTGKNLWNMAADNRTSWSSHLTEDEDGWIIGTGYDGFYNLWTAPNLELEPSTTYYYVLEVAELFSANANDRLQITSEATSTSNNCQFTEAVNILWSSLQAGGVYTGAITTKSSFSGNNSMLRSFLRPYSTASRIKFRLSIVKEQPDTASFIYEPFVGEQPSPSPDYPQPIQTVTGEQTVTINSTNYPISLGSIELCKLGTYQDYIYKDGDDWKVHKATDKRSIDGTTGTWSNPSTNRFNLDGAIAGYAKQNGLKGYCEDYVVLGQTSNNSDFNTLASNYGFAINFGSQTSNNIRFKNSDCSTIQDIQSALLGNPAVIYYALATATDTVITDTDLIAQLEAIRTASLQNGANTITNTATGSNLAGDMEIGYYGFDPRNRYDKWLWLDINNEYEQIGS